MRGYDDPDMSPREPHRPAGLRVGTDKGAAGVLGLALIGGFWYAWSQIGWWALLILLGIFFWRPLLLVAAGVLGLAGLAGSREVNAELARIVSLEKDRNVVGLISMLDSETRGRSKYSIVRDHAATALGRLRDPRAAPYLVERLSDPEEMVRFGAVSALGLLKVEETEGAVLKALADSAPVVRASAATALGRMGARAAIPNLREAVTSDPDRDVRLHAVESLVLLGDKDSRARVPEVLNRISWRLRGHPRWRRLAEVAVTGEPLTPWIAPYE